MISYVEAMIKISEDFMHVVTNDAYKPGHRYMWYHTLISFALLKHWSEILQARLEQEMKERQELGAQLEAERAERQA